jgi:type II pantothenate kinase
MIALAPLSTSTSQDRLAILSSFAAGVVAATLARSLYNHTWRSQSLWSFWRGSKCKGAPADNSTALSPPDDASSHHEQPSSTQRKSLLQRMEETVNISRIGELPHSIQRTRWPWDRMKRSSSHSDSSDERLGNGNPLSAVESVADRDDMEKADLSANAESTDFSDEKSSLCIGAIFGLDVGGTLAKLCYFEQVAQPSSSQPHQRSDQSDSILDGDDLSQKRRQRARTMQLPFALDGCVPLHQHGDHEDTFPNHDVPHRRVARRQRSNSLNGSSEYQRVATKPGYFAMPIQVRLNDETDATQNERTAINPRSNLRSSILHRASDDNLENPRQEVVRERVETYLISEALFRQEHVRHSEEKASVMNAGRAHPHGSVTPSTMRRARSMFDMGSVALDKNQWKHHAAALDRFYSFARRLDSYRAGIRDPNLSFYSHELGGEFHFMRFETKRMQNAMELIRAHKLHLNIHEMGGTGGGAHKFASVWREQLGITMKKQDELDSLVAGMQFVLSTVVGECYTFRPPRKPSDMPAGAAHSRSESGNSSHPTHDDEDDRNGGDNGLDSEDRGKGDEWWWSRKVQRDSISYSATYPYLVVTIGTGVSVLRVDGPRQYERVSGSTIGGGTYLGLIRLLTDVEDFDDVMRLAERGDPSKVDMMVGDIYGENSDALEKLGLPSNLVASSFGKLVAKEDPAAGLKQEDLARALLMMITNNIGQVAHLNAKLFNTPRIYFVGNFLRHNKISQRRLSYAIHYWSKGEMEALFLEHEGYFGALGAFLLAQQISVT